MKYNNDYKTDDPRWSMPLTEAVKGKGTTAYFKKLHEDAQIPEYKSEEAAGMDLRSVDNTELAAGEVKVVATGLAMSLPKGFEAQIRPRSGLAAKHGVTVLNSPGTIDSDYRGEVKIILINHGKYSFPIAAGDRIAQMVIARVEQPLVREVETLDETERGAGGLGSTGVK